MLEGGWFMIPDIAYVPRLAATLLFRGASGSVAALQIMICQNDTRTNYFHRLARKQIGNVSLDRNRKTHAAVVRADSGCWHGRRPAGAEDEDSRCRVVSHHGHRDRPAGAGARAYQRGFGAEPDHPAVRRQLHSF